MRDAEPEVYGTIAVTPLPSKRRSEWVAEHFVEVPERIGRFLDFGGREFTGRDGLDIGCGDGLIDAGIFTRFSPHSLRGVDFARVDTDALLREVRQVHRDWTTPPGLRFQAIPSGALPFRRDTFDFALAWSVFEHADDLPTLASEIARVLRPGGLFLVQVFPLWWSANGGHLWYWTPPFAHLSLALDELIATATAAETDDPAWRRYLIAAARSTNRATLEDIQTALRSAGFRIAKVETARSAFHVPDELQDVPLSRLAIAEIMLLAQLP